MHILAYYLIMYFFLSACSVIQPPAEVFHVSDLNRGGMPQGLQADATDTETRETKNDELYVIKPGDALSIKFFFNPELNEQDLIVRPDGRISLQLIHEVEAENLTAPQLSAHLAERYTGQLKNPEIAVIVRSVQEYPKVYVDGEVNHPGTFRYLDSLSVLQVVALAGGFTSIANKGEVTVIRRNQKGHPFVIKLDANAFLIGQDLTQNIPLLPNDFVYVGRSFW
ncbi:MAG: sugar ABC transporter substrate-binding protein [Nitrospirales bacterium]|nr:MAG: sugar ABC transporter substrate-binding protein [Nitrospirales bacterium]